MILQTWTDSSIVLSSNNYIYLEVKPLEWDKRFEQLSPFSFQNLIYHLMILYYQGVSFVIISQLTWKIQEISRISTFPILTQLRKTLLHYISTMAKLTGQVFNIILLIYPFTFYNFSFVRNLSRE